MRCLSGFSFPGVSLFFSFGKSDGALHFSFVSASISTNCVWPGGGALQVDLLENFEEEVKRLHDEVDILKPAEMKVSKLEDNLARCVRNVKRL